jgi:hypothetical protein
MAASTTSMFLGSSDSVPSENSNHNENGRREGEEHVNGAFATVLRVWALPRSTIMIERLEHFKKVLAQKSFKSVVGSK